MLSGSEGCSVFADGPDISPSYLYNFPNLLATHLINTLSNLRPYLYLDCRGYGVQIEIIDTAAVVQQSQQLKDVGGRAMFLSPEFFTLGLVCFLLE